LFGYHPDVGLYRGGKFANFLNKQAPEGRRDIENAKIPFRAVATDLFTGEPYIIDKGPIGTALRASAAIPWLRKPVPLNGKLLCDGVLAGNLPVVLARDMGADVVIAVSVDGPIKPATDSDFHRVKYVENRTATLLMSKLDEQYLKLADLVLQPDVADVNVLSTNREDIENALAAGEKAAREAMPEIRKLLQLPKVQSALDGSSTK
jgi:NTE family protein